MTIKISVTFNHAITILLSLSYPSSLQALLPIFSYYRVPHHFLPFSPAIPLFSLVALILRRRHSAPRPRHTTATKAMRTKNADSGKHAFPICLLQSKASCILQVFDCTRKVFRPALLVLRYALVAWTSWGEAENGSGEELPRPAGDAWDILI